MQYILTIRQEDGVLIGYSEITVSNIYVDNSIVNGNLIRVLEEPLLNSENYLLSNYYKEGEIRKLPEKPSEYHLWNLQSEQWQHSEELYNAFIVRKETEVKTQRNRLLMQSDYTELPSFLQRNGEVVVAEWQTYRQALRDITLQAGYPLDVIWPTQP